MPVEVTNQRKRSSLDATDATVSSGGDHRKRRRNRTMQSCINCHTSKRMCDRKRPCGRCTQLGLSGLCVFEVDDPNHGKGPDAELARLQSRITELEGIIRDVRRTLN
ncbi:uncharacterized protein STEHIDRAFT_63656 [Stereum hirsutum FP-91666 SS1]|uniref:uncharacterized protein n=1 Tax=Stereum hirsutum (strain FP-91666) TaxID=721885 RepID=UPI0004449797|nr:uncharacterized protein STEHIDRAFT_63656 [Stereum hirsutum FP-91666 SS1]EIM83098.1 hypothetical protein STEHIDRAFT_63656 [Stereum hirsutum FP-91666 SS1]